MKTPIIFICMLSFLFYCSCSDDDSYVPIDKNYIEISLNGENFTVNTVGSSYYPYQNDSLKPLIFDGIATIRTANYTFLFSICHYVYFRDFEHSQTGIYNICDTCISSYTNLDVSVYLLDRTESDSYTSLMPGAKHKVDNLSDLEDDSPSSDAYSVIKYRIKGELNNMTFRNKSNEDIVVLVKYEAFISLQK